MEAKNNPSIGPSAKRSVVKTWLRLAAGLLVVGAVLVVLLMERVAERVKRFNCAGNQHCIVLNLIIYAGDDKEYGFFPSGNDFGLMTTEGYAFESKVFNCPSTPAVTTSSRDSDFQYFGDGICDWVTNPERVPLMADRERNHDGWFNVCFADGHCSGYSAPDWQTLVAEQGWDKEWERARSECSGRRP
jgi:prepilin-type processing-associated H-X9-DG protein